MTYDHDMVASLTMSRIIVKANCVIIRTSDETIHVIKKESILAYRVSGTYGTYVEVYTTMPNLQISVQYSMAEGQQCIKDVEVLHSVLSPPVQTTGDLLTMTDAIPNPAVPKN